MKIFIICSKAFYQDARPIVKVLEEKGHQVTVPNSFDHPSLESEMWRAGKDVHSKFKKEMLLQSEQIISNMDAVLCLNFEKDGKPNYIGGATFLELYEAFMKRKKIFLWNDIPEGMLFDEISAFQPVIISGNLDVINHE